MCVFDVCVPSIETLILVSAAVAPVANTKPAAAVAAVAIIGARVRGHSRIAQSTLNGALCALALPAALDALTAQRTDRPCRLLVTLSVERCAPALVVPLTRQL
jgi:hypothetical protein